MCSKKEEYGLIQSKTACWGVANGDSAVFVIDPHNASCTYDIIAIPLTTPVITYTMYVGILPFGFLGEFSVEVQSPDRYLDRSRTFYQIVCS